MSTPMDTAKDGPVKASRVTKSKGLSAGFDYGDQEDQTSTAAAYQFKTQETTSAPNLDAVATLPAPAYDSTSNSEEKETETTQLKSEGEGLTASAAAPDDDGSDEQPNNTGLPNELKSGVESLSGVSLDDVNVHFNSAKPAQLKAHAYAQGTDIHLGAGQEKHLPHEAWHVVQQKQGRVNPTMQMKGKVPVNDDAGLEKEADVMGAKAVQMKAMRPSVNTINRSIHGAVAQMTFNDAELKTRMGAYKFDKAKAAEILDDYREKTEDELEKIKGMERIAFDKIVANRYLTRDDDFEDAQPESWLGWGMSALGFGTDKEKDADKSHTFMAGGKEGAASSMRGLQEDGALQDMPESAIDNASQNKEEEEEDDGTPLEKGLKMITINLLEGKSEGEKELGKGVKAKGKAEGGLEYTPGDQHKVTGKVAIEFELGKGGEKVIGNGKYGSDQNNMRVGGIVQGLMGVKGQASAEGEFNPKEGTYGVKGKAGASAGVSAEGKVKLVLKAKGVEVAQASMKGGVMAGLAAQGAFTLKYDKGEFTFGTAGKLAAGVGVTWSYKLSVNTPGMMAKLGDNITSFAKWGASSIYNNLPSMF